MMLTLSKSIKQLVAVTVLSISVTGNARPFGFEKEPNTAQTIQLMAALASYPASLVAQARPNSNFCAFLEHSTKLLNEAFALYNQAGWNNTLWFFYDGIQGLRTILAVVTGNDLDEQELQKLMEATANIKKGNKPASQDTQAQPNAETNDKTTEKEQPEASETDEDRRAKQVIAVTFATIEAAARVMVSFNNAKELPALKQNQRYHYNEIVNCISTMARLANYYLRTKNPKYKALIVGLVAVTVVGAYYSYAKYQGYKPAIEERERVMAPVSEKRPDEAVDDKQGKNANDNKNGQEAFDQQAFITCYEEMIKEDGMNSLTDVNADAFCNRLDRFCKNYHVKPFFEEQQGGFNPNRQYIRLFWLEQERNDLFNQNHEPHETAANFIRAYQHFVQRKERDLGPIRRRRPLFGNDHKQAALVAFNYDDFATCCRLFGQQAGTGNERVINYDTADHLLTEFDAFCAKFGIGSFFNHDNVNQQRHRDLFAQYWDLDRNHQNRRPRWLDARLGYAYYQYNPFTSTYNGYYGPFGYEYYIHPDRADVIRDFCNGFRDYIADQRQRQRQQQN